LVRFSLLGVSIVCFAARLGISQYRESKSAGAVQTQNLARESGINGMAILDSKGKYIYVNSSYAKMMGYPHPEPFLGIRWDELSNAQDVVPVRAELDEGLGKHGKWYGPVTVHRSDVTALPMEIAVTLLPDGGTICITRDISQRLSE